MHKKTLLFVLFGAALMSCVVAYYVNPKTIQATYCKEEAVEKETAKQELILESEKEVVETYDAIPIGIILNTDDMKTKYLINEPLDTTGLNVLLNYDDGKTKEILLEDCGINGVETSSYGEKELIVTYGDFSSSVMVEVIFTVETCEPKTMYSTTSLSIRKGPDTSFDSIDTLELNESVVVNGVCDNGWSRIDYAEDVAYVSTKYLSNELVVVPCEPKTMYSKTSLNIRKGPGTSYEAIGTYNLNSEVKVTGTCGTWSRVEYKEQEAYVSGKYLSDKKIEVQAKASVGNSGDTAAVLAQMQSRGGMIGRLYIPGVGLNVALFNGWSQGVVDAKDSAGTYRYGGGQMMIADHKNQGFSAIKSAVPGQTIAYINNGRTVQAYKCIAKGTGQNKATGVPYDLLDCNGNSLYLQNGGGIGMYTCNSHWSSITYTMWAPI